jgi:hypothetical protein
MNTLINIDEALWFEGNREGGTLNFRTEGDGPEGLHFQVGISYRSLMECYETLSRGLVEWKIRDSSLAIYGDQEELLLHFNAPDHPEQRGDHVLRGRELSAFRYAVHALGSRFTALLN